MHTHPALVRRAPCCGGGLDPVTVSACHVTSDIMVTVSLNMVTPYEGNRKVQQAEGGRQASA